MPLLFIDVNIAPGKTQRLSIFDGDTPEALALDFVRQHGLSERMHAKLENSLKIQMEDIDDIKEQQRREREEDEAEAALE